MNFAGKSGRDTLWCQQGVVDGVVETGSALQKESYHKHVDAVCHVPFLYVATGAKIALTATRELHPCHRTIPVPMISKITSGSHNQNPAIAG